MSQFLARHVYMVFEQTITAAATTASAAAAGICLFLLFVQIAVPLESDNLKAMVSDNYGSAWARPSWPSKELRDEPRDENAKIQNATFGRIKPIVPGLFRIGI